MRFLLCNELEPIAYLIYMAAIALYYKHYKLFRHKVLFFYSAGAAIMLYAGILVSVNNNWSYNLLFFINICVSSWYFYGMLKPNTKQRVVLICWLLNTLLFGYVNIAEGRYNSYNSYTYGVSYITIVVYSLLYLHQLLTDVGEENLLLNFDFWMVCGYLFYFLGSFIIILYYDDKIYTKQRGNMWAMHNLILFICSVITLYVSLRILNKSKPVDE